MISHRRAHLDSQALLIVGSVIFFALSVCLVVLWAGNISLLNTLYPAIAAILGVLLYIWRPSFYMGFTFWLWFITPFIRRLIDYHTGSFSSLSLVMLTPYIVTGLSLFTVLRYAKELLKRRYFPFALAILGVVYGYGIGILSFGLFAATYNLLEWLVPLLFGCHILLNWHEYPSQKRVVRAVFSWGVLVLGTYGIFQFFTAPAWDAFWMTHSNMSSIGHPEPFRIRVFSLLNSPGPFGMYMMVGLIVLFNTKGIMSRLAMAPGYVALLLSLVRTSWGAWVVAILYVIRYVTGSMRKRLIVLIILATVLTVPLFFIRPITEKVSTRVATLGNLGDDGSLQTRVGIYTSALGIITQPIGHGLGSLGGSARFTLGRRLTLDSGLIAIPYTLGWLGTFFFLGAWISMIKIILRVQRKEVDEFGVFAGGIAMAFSAALLFSNQLIGPKGVLAWAFLALALSSRAYHQERDEDVVIEPVELPLEIAEPVHA